MSDTAASQPSAPDPLYVQTLNTAGAVVSVRQLGAAGLRIGSWEKGCQIVLDGPGVGRMHALIRWDGSEASVLVLTTTQETLLRERPLQPNRTYPWGLHQPLRIGSYQLVLVERAEATQPAAPAQPPLASAAAYTTDAGPFSLMLNTPSVELTPGMPKTLRLTITNRGSVADQAELSIIGGIPSEWCTLIPETVDLAPQEPVDVELRVNVPRNPRNLPGQREVVLRAQSSDDTQPLSELSMKWTVLTYAVAPRLLVEPRQ